jgi:hypothetical protein
VRRFVLVGLALVSGVSAARGQILKVPNSGGGGTVSPWWVSGGIGLMQLSDITDGKSNSVWQFGDGAQYRGTLEYEPSVAATGGIGGALGLAVAYARPSLVYQPFTSAGGGGSALGGNAHADVWTVEGMFRYGGGRGLFGTFGEVRLGATQFSNFKLDEGDTKLTPSATDFSWAFGFGFAFRFTPGAELDLGEDFGRVIHSRAGLAGNAQRTGFDLTTRAAFRIRI